MNVHAQQALEFDRLRDHLARRAASLPGGARARCLAPLSDLADVRAVLAKVDELLRLRRGESQWPTLRFPDLAPALNIVRVEGTVLEAQPLMDAAALLEVATRVATHFAGSERLELYPHLAETAAPLFIEREFPARISRTFEPSGELRDDASSALRAIRLRLRQQQQAVSQRLEKMSRVLRSSTEESFVTLRGGRYVLSVAMSERRRIKGIVHDRSATGKTAYLEPLEAVEPNNALAELEADERAECHRILRELTAWVREHAARLAATQDCLVELDELNARAHLAEDLEAQTPDLDGAGERLRIVRGRHPLLLLAGNKEVVPLELELAGEAKALVVSGPNMGGKTVVLKTTGLLVLMVAAGLPVPAADGTVIPWVDDIFVDIGDEQSLEGDLSTYAGHLRNMEAILSGASASSLVLIDELGAGTDPDEGAALGLALLGEIARRGSLCITTTHLGAFKVFAADGPGFTNAAMEHDPQTLVPTYRLQVGLPGRSHAFELARREGWPAEMLAKARAHLSGARMDTEKLLSQVQAERERLRNERGALSAEREQVRETRAAAGRLSRELEDKLLALRRERVLEEDHRLRELRQMLRALKEKVAATEALDRDGQQAELRRWVHAQERQAATIEKTQQRDLRPAAAVHQTPLAPEQLVPGRRVHARSLGVDVTLGERERDGQRFWVQHKGVRIRLPRDDFTAPVDEAPAAAPVVLHAGGEAATREAQAATVSGELDLRGLDRNACLERLDRFLDRAVLAGMIRLRVIHGKGSGVLRRAVGEFLGRCPQVDSFREGESGEGGWGVTMVFLKTSRGKAHESRH